MLAVEFFSLCRYCFGWLFPHFSPFISKKCQKIGHFSLEKAFFAFFLAMVLACTINFAEKKRRNRQ